MGAPREEVDINGEVDENRLPGTPPAAPPLAPPPPPPPPVPPPPRTFLFFFSRYVGFYKCFFTIRTFSTLIIVSNKK